MSSPDPLNDSTMAELASLPPSSATRRVTRSQSSQRFLELGSSPRKQMFELQVGDRTSPQRLLVTVETEGQQQQQQQQQQNSVGSNAKRKLFQSPASASSTPARRLRGRTTTTSVPLRESIEEEVDDATTPKPRVRQRKSNGTPMPSAGTKRRATTPGKRTPRRPRITMSVDGEEPSSEEPELSVQATPTPKRNLRPRRTPRTGTTRTSSEPATEITPRPSTARRGRRRRQALAPDELLELADEVGDINLDTTILPPVTSEDEVDLVRAPSDSSEDGSLNEPETAPAPVAPSTPSPVYAPAAAQPDSDIWIADLSHEATPRASTRRGDVIPESSPRFPPAEPEEERDVETSQAGDYGDYGYGDLGPAASDRSSTGEPLGDDEAPTTVAPGGYDTIAQGEDFSMIFMDSIPSLQADFNSSVHHPIPHEELGDETNLIINNTLESLRQEVDLDDSEDDVDEVDAIESAELGPVEEEVVERETTPIRQSSSPSRQSPGWSRSPRKAVNTSPLRLRVLKQNARQTEESAAMDAMQGHELPSSPASDRRPRSPDRPEEEVSNLYEDSFSEIPDAVLAAATPRRPQASISYDDLEDEVDQVQMIDAESDEMLDGEDVQNLAKSAEQDEEESQHAVVHGEQDVRYPELPQQMVGVRDAEAQEEVQVEDEPESEEAEDLRDELNEDEYSEPELAEDEEQADDDEFDEVEAEEVMQEEEEEEEEEAEDEPIQIEDVQDSDIEPEEPQEVSLRSDEDEDQREEEYEDDEDAEGVQQLEPEEDHEQGDLMHIVDDGQVEEEEEDDLVELQKDPAAPPRLEEPDEVSLDEEMVEAVNDYDEGEDQDEDEDEPEEHAVMVAASVASTVPQSDPARLPTPDNTPPQAEFQLTEDAENKSNRGSRPPSRLRSSPRSPVQFGGVPHITVEQPEEVEEPEDEEMEYEQPEEEESEEQAFDPEPRHEPAAAEAARRSIDATPPHQISSPVHEPLSLQPESLLDKTVRPHLSTIIRAGRVLQSITSDPPSPEGREKQLGSPFRRSGSKDSWSGSKDSQTSRRMSRSPMQPRRFAPSAAKWGSPAHHEASESAPGATTQTSFQNALRRSKEPSMERERSPSRHSPASSMHITPPSDGAMSWVAREGPISPQLRGDNSLREAAGLPNVAVQSPASVDWTALTPKKPVEEQQPHEPSPQVEEQPEANQGPIRDDDTDIWELEAERETPRSTRQQPFGKRVAPSNNRRGAIPSPWTKRSVHRPAISRMISQAVPDLSHLTEEPSVLPDQPAPSSSPDEYSRLAQSQKEEAAKKASKAPESAAKANRFDLSSFFSSPAALPGLLAQKFMPTKPRNAAPAPGNPSMAMAGQAPPVVPTSSMFPQIPQKDFRPDSSNRSALFSPARRRQPAARRQEEQPAESPEQPQLQPQPQPQLQRQRQLSDSPVERSSSPATPEQVPMPAIAQKQNFTPRPRQASQSFFQPSSNPSVAVTPPRMQLSHADIHRWTQQTSNVSEASSDFQRPLLRPLPPKNASPTKSSLRSPLKPHTPGRVVEFTSSVLSPAEQAKARHDSSRLSNSIISQDFFDPPAPPPQPTTQDDKENASIDDISMDDAPPLTKPPPPQPLSQTTWSRQHWLLLDELLQLRRTSPLPVKYARRADQYLGKTVKSHGRAMTLERWHLDCVDAFKAEVGGWDEGVLAKRLFALILGEERRRDAGAQVERRVMFH